MRFKFILFFILVIAGLLRFVALDIVPPSLTWDEVAWGYNAYTIGIDGKDEFGRFLPLDYLESFGDFKPPVYAYLTVLPVKIFGLNEFATRFPSAFFGTLTVLVTYLLTKRIFQSENHKNSLVEMYALISAGLLAVSPWHINLSRAAFEANVATFFLVSGVWLFLKAVQKNTWYLTISAISFVLSMYTFNTARIVAPLLVLLLAAGTYRQLWANKKQVIVSAILGLVILLPAIPFLLSPQAKLRYEEVNIFSDINIINRTNEQISRDNNAWWSKIIHNRRLAYGVAFINHYFDNLSPNFLFIKGDGNPKFSTQDVGQMYLWELPFLLAGTLLLFRKRDGYWWLIPSWLLLAIIPAATARETPHALRIVAALPTFQILVAYGIVNIFSNYLVQSSKFRIVATIIMLFTCFISTAYYLNGYYNYYPQEFSGEWQYGYKDAVAFVQSHEAEYDRIYITEELGRPYIYFLFYSNYDVNKFRKEAVVTRETLGFVHVESFGKYNFTKNIQQKSGTDIGKTLYIDVPGKVPVDANIIKTFYLLNKKPALVAYSI